MAAAGETMLKQKTETMPTPGTIAHLEYLHELEIDDDSTMAEAPVFLAETMAATSLARIIRRHRTYWPMRNLQVADLDSRMLGSNIARPAFFRGSIGISQALPDHNLLLIHSLHDCLNNSYTYDIAIPVTPAHYYDSSRPTQAAYRIQSGEKERHDWIYNEIAAPEYDEHDPQVLICAVQEAADDLMRLLGHTPGSLEGSPKIEPADVAFPMWPDDYRSDDPDEFLKKPREQW